VRERKPPPRGSYKLIGVDLDGTLLGFDGRPHPVDVAALREVRARGVHVTVITGRLYAGSKASVIAIGADGPVACADGSHIVNGATHTTVMHRGLAGSGADALRDALRASDATTFVFARDTIYHDERGKGLIPFVQIWSDDIRQAPLFGDEVWDHEQGLTAVVAIGREPEIQRVISSVSSHGSIQVNHFPIRRIGEGMWGLIVRSQGGTKGSALAYIAAHHGVDVDECVVVGDWHNDVPMFGVAGRAFAMGQAPDAVKDVATDVLTETAATGGGIARAIAEAFGGRA
jgi:Cof subfamily protein (haloacid dehalogenase superfamily)